MMSQNDHNCVKRLKYSAVTKNPCYELEFKWTIEDHDKLAVHVSPEMQLPGTTWCFVYKYVSNTQMYKVLIRSSSDKSVFVTGKLTFKGQFSYSEERNLNKRLNVNAAVYKGENILCSREESFLRYDPTLCLVLKVYGLFKPDSVLCCESASQNDMRNENLYVFNILKKILMMRQNNQISDVQIQAGKKYLKAHKFILFAMSPVFAAMFRNPSLENSQKIIKVTDVSFEVMELLIGFMYGKVPDQDDFGDWKKLCELYYASDKYQVLDLRDECRSGLVKKMTLENVWELLDLSDRHSDEELKREVFDFCCTHYKSVVETEGWKNLIEKKPLVASSMLKQFPYISK